MCAHAGVRIQGSLPYSGRKCEDGGTSGSQTALGGTGGGVGEKCRGQSGGDAGSDGCQMAVRRQEWWSVGWRQGGRSGGRTVVRQQYGRRGESAGNEGAESGRRRGGQKATRGQKAAAGRWSASISERSGGQWGEGMVVVKFLSWLVIYIPSDWGHFLD